MESLLFFDKVVLESYTIRSRKNVIVITKWAIRRSGGVPVSAHNRHSSRAPPRFSRPVSGVSIFDLTAQVSVASAGYR